AAELVGDAVPGLAAEPRGFRSAPAAVVHLGIATAELAQPLDGFGFLIAASEGMSVLGCVYESALWPGRAPTDATLVRCILGGARDPAAIDEPDDALVAACVRDLRRALGAFPTPHHAHVVRHGRGIAQYGLGHRERLV